MNFKITKSEIDELMNSGLFSINDNNDVLSINQDSLNPISKLLYSLVCKQGDLQKLTLIIKGIKEAENPKLEKHKPLVFYCFCNHLAKQKEYPIIDQRGVYYFGTANVH